MKNTVRLAFSLALVVASGCSSFRKAEKALETKRLKDFAAAAKVAPPVPVDSAGKYPAGVELDVLDALLQKYPGRQRTKTIIETKIVEVPGKVLEAPVRTKTDTLANVSERDSLLKEMVRLTENEKEGGGSLLKIEVAKLKSRLLVAFNQRGYLPDTTIFFPKDSASFTIKRVDKLHYLFTCVVAPRTIRVPTRTDITQHDRVAQDMRHYYDFWQFKASAAANIVLVMAIGWITIKAVSRGA
jgi:hypothetical protein